MTTKNEENLHSSPKAQQLSGNHTPNLLTPSSDHYDIDALSDAGTYIIEDDPDIVQDDITEQNNNSSSSFKRYANPSKHRHGTFDIHGMISSAAHTIHRPVVDSNIPTRDIPSPSLSNSSSLSSVHSFSNENDQSIQKDVENASENKSSNGLKSASNTLLQQKSTTPPKIQIKPAECFGKTLHKKTFLHVIYFSYFTDT
jgi:hypothetical protein